VSSVSSSGAFLLVTPDQNHEQRGPSSVDVLMNHAVVRAVAVTLVALLAYRAGLQVPLTGIDATAVADRELTSMARLSVMALGVMPWLLAMKLVELASLLLPAPMAQKLAPDGHAGPFTLSVMAAALLISYWQGYGVAIAIERTPGLVPNRPIAFAWVNALNMMVGTALIIALGRVVERYGVGSGFWIMLAGYLLDGVLQKTMRSVSLVTDGVSELPELAFALGSDLLVAAAVAALLLARQRAGFKRAEQVLWPMLLAPLVVSFVAVLASFVLPHDDPSGVDHLLVANTLPGFVAHAVAISLLVVRYAQRDGSRGFIVPTIALSVGAMLALPNLLFAAPLQPLLGGTATVIVTAILVVVTQRMSALSGERAT
jgi:hypothetical protein